MTDEEDNTEERIHTREPLYVWLKYNKGREKITHTYYFGFVPKGEKCGFWGGNELGESPKEVNPERVARELRHSFPDSEQASKYFWGGVSDSYPQRIKIGRRIIAACKREIVRENRLIRTRKSLAKRLEDSYQI